MDDLLKNKIEYLQHLSTSLSIEKTLQLLTETFPGKVAFSTSFSFEDQAITDLIEKNTKGIFIFTLDTGRLFSETYNVWSRTNEQYGLKIKSFIPISETIENFVNENGPNAFYESIELRKSCCFIRKVEPLQRALAGHSVWITGLRAEHSPLRKTLELIEWDDVNKIIKYNPLLHWTIEEVIQYVKQNTVPYNVLHDQGFISIGCAPCTRAVKPGEDFRAGRWWWEDASKKECGLHTHAVQTN
jgi:phosphoadenosine phosphosulfate reductase